MKSVLKIAIKGIFKRKTYTIAILFLTIIAAVSMVTAIGTIFRAQDIYNASYEKSNSPDMLYFYSDKNYSKDYEDFFKKRDEVRSVLPQACVLETSDISSINGNDISHCVFREYKPDENNFNISTEKKRKALSDNEVYVPLIYENECDAKIGGKFIINTSQGDKEYTIAGFFEDPILGSSFMDIKYILFSADGYKNIETLTLNSTTIPCTILNVYLKSNFLGSSFDKTTQEINMDFGKDTLSIFYYTKSFFQTGALVLPKIIAVVLFCFSALLIIIVAIVIRHAILSSIEADYVSLGVLKAIGFTGKNIISAILLQYTIISTAGTIAGVVLGIFTTPIIGKVLVNSTGIFWSGNLTVPTALSVIAGILIVIEIISYLTARKTAKISPVMAISFGKSPVHFSSRINIPLSHLNFLPLSIKMSLKQMMTKLKQYSTLIVITTIFTFMIITVTTFASNFSTTENMYKVMGFTMHDIDISSADSSKCSLEELDTMVQEIDKTYGIKQVYSSDFDYLMIDDISLNANIKSNFDGDTLIDGKLPEFDNEIAITPVMSKVLDKGIGEKVELKSKVGVKSQYIITGTVQCISNMGKYITLPVCGYEKIMPNYKQMRRSITLKENSDIDNIIADLKQKYETSDNGISIVNSIESYKNMLKTLSSAIMFASSIVFVLTFILIACITILLCTITVYREIHETGIFKAIGFKAIELRLQFTFRFMLIAVIGGATGIILSLLLNEKMIGAMLSSVGIANLKPIWNFSSIGFPLIFVVCVTGITAFFSSAKIKKISPSSLINE